MRVMRRTLTTLAATAVTYALLAPVALAIDSSQGTYGEADDKVVTNAGFLLILFFPLFVFAMSMLQGALDRRKERRKKAHKDLAGDERAWRGGW
jgi:hypothetical protein